MNKSLATPRGVSVIIPSFNEEEAILNVVKETDLVMSQSKYDYEIVVVNDGSTDRTREILEELRIPQMRLCTHASNKGYGASLKTGIKKSGYDHVAIMDGDGTYPWQKLPELLDTYFEEDFDMVVGKRDAGSSAIPAMRKPAKWFLTKLANYLAEEKIPDLNSGLRVIRKDILLDYFHMLPSGFSFTTTVTLLLLTNGYDVKYIPIEYKNRKGKSKIRPIHDTLNFVQLITRTVMYFSPLKIFVPLSLTLFGSTLISLSFDFRTHHIAGKTVIFFVSFCIVLSIGLLADLINKRLP